MPAPTGSQSPSLDAILHSLQQSFNHGDAAQAQSQIQKAKLALLQQNALIPSQQTPPSTLATARSILEAGALLSIRSRDPESFVRYYSQLQPFYDFPGLQQTPSQNRSKITGLYLLLLLSQGDYAGFHTLLETLIVAEGSNGASTVEDDQYIKYPIELERSLMEGSYDQVWRKTNGRDVPGEEFALFSDILINTIRLEIASCAARSYPSLPIASAKNLLFLDSEGAVMDFANEQGWSLEEGRIYFPGLEDAKKTEEGDQKEVINHMVGYARELEMIV
ncbi:regulatory particle non-ATPase [Exophiala xenobiotica]|uniref:Regulatory particle non-ATPase n=1 Tax=Vermiconidia calcicola TaxID=1690605 RepID=A0AAV9QDM5_9PEZI|nr:regulatory particle non-ATPase [Exophiala xenobiotica]KAK5540948.1 regulatory particle non-ATPase [Vermiconidia calcicola]KAK5549561.1 regulatory particle non-ATPase [Chaetothyriales sp. CCFEE 6169]KAK5193791.1 regulatory particle non-ATPase [Exophiala xenobiotica]KAK5208183.1 regulatory particle non-ATPase [Exophiala xenobiotica]